MPWVAGDPVPSPAAGQVLVEQVFTHPRQLRVMVLVTSKVGMDVILRLLAANSFTVKQSHILPVTASLWASPALGPFIVDRNERLQVISRDAVTAAEAQASLFYEP